MFRSFKIGVVRRIIFVFGLLAFCMLPVFSYSAPSGKKGSGNSAPNVSIVSPQSGMTALTGTSINLVAYAEDSDGFIESVSFYRDAEFISFATINDSNEWEALWTSSSAGTFLLTAVARDSSGAETVSAAVEVNVVEQAASPVFLEIMNPVDETILTEGEQLNIIVNLDDPAESIQKIELFNGNELLHSMDTEPYESLWKATNAGFHVLFAKATNDKGEIISSTPIRVVVEQQNISPMVSLSWPEQCTNYETLNTIYLEADALDVDGEIKKVEFYANGNLIGEDTRKTFSTQWTSIFPGTYQLYVKAIDNKGAISVSDAVDLEVFEPNIEPWVNIVEPQNNVTVTTGSEVLLVADAGDEDGYIEEVFFYSGSQLIASLKQTPYTFSWQVPDVVGDYVITAKAKDDDGAISTSEQLHVEVRENEVPTVALSSPLNGTSIEASSSVLLAANASDIDGYVSLVSFYQNNILLSEDYDAPYEFLWENVEEGNYLITAKAIDNDGAVSDSEVVSIDVLPKQLANIFLESPLDGQSYTLGSDVYLKASVEGFLEGVTQVQFFSGSEIIGVDESYPYEFIWQPSVLGQHVITAKAITTSGSSITSSPLTLSIVGEELELTVTSLQDGDAVPDSFAIVEGKFVAPENSGIMVNGVAASIYEDGYYANIPLELGQNNIEVTLTTQTGQSISRNLIIHSVILPSDIEIVIGSTQVYVPFSKNVKLINHGDEDVSVQLNGSTMYPLLAGATRELTLSGTSPGVYHNQIAVMDAQGMLITHDFVFVAIDKSEVDQLLRRNWSAMLDELSGGDVEGALAYFSDKSRDRYRDAFETLAYKMPQIVSGFSSLQSSNLGSEYAEYGVNRIINGENHLFFVYYLKDGQGIWRIQSM